MNYPPTHAKLRLTVILLCFQFCAPVVNNATDGATTFLNRVNDEKSRWNNKRALANWRYATNLTDENLEDKLRVSSQVANYSKRLWEQVNSFPWRDLRDADLKRQFEKLSILGVSVLPEEQHNEYNKIIGTMQNVYSTAKICSYRDRSVCDVALEPGLNEVLKRSRDPEELKYVWVEWRNASGKRVRSMFEKYVELSNMASRLNNFTDTSSFWLDAYEANDIVEQIETLWQQVKPFYLQIHAYVRYQLNKFYGDDVVSKDGPIPAHLLGNMWSQTWKHIGDIGLPYPNKTFEDVSEEMVRQGYDANRMFRLAESCFVSMNMSAMPDTFWKNSVLEKPTDREIICHASAWDLSDGKDFRIKMCTKVSMDHLMVVHHEMGHVQYYLQYKNQSVAYRGGANPGFHEAVGDVMALSVSTPKHLKRIGLIKSDNVDDPEVVLNDLHLKALDKVVFLPYAYVMDKWRWNIFQGKIAPGNYNCEWWKFREEFQGIEPPVDRTEDDFDPGAKYHIVSNTEYLRYFIAHIIQFQFHKALCIAAGEYDPRNSTARPLHNCDITDSTNAGNLLKSMLQMGESKPWQEAMERLTGQGKMDASGLLEYFQPLYDWLRTTNENNGAVIGWTKSRTHCSPAK